MSTKSWSGPCERAMTIAVVGALYLLLALMARTLSAILRQSFVLYGR